MTITDPAPDAAPRSAPKRKHRARAARPSIEPRVRVLLTMAGTAWQAADGVCGGAFMEQVPELASAIDLWAKQDAKLYRWLDGMTGASGPLAVAVAAMPIAQTVTLHHVLPAIERRRAERAALTVEDFDAQTAAYADADTQAEGPLLDDDQAGRYVNPSEVVGGTR